MGGSRWRGIREEEDGYGGGEVSGWGGEGRVGWVCVCLLEGLDGLILIKPARYSALLIHTSAAGFGRCIPRHP